MGDPECFVKKVISEGEFSRVIVNFGHGALSSEDTQEAECSLFLDKSDERKQIATVKIKNQLLFGNIDNSAVCQTMLLIKKKSKSKGWLLPVPATTLVKPILKRKAVESFESVNAGKEEKIADYIALSKTFGSKRSKRQSELRLKISQNVVDNTQEISETVTKLDIKSSDVDNDNERNDLSDVLPPCNRSATDVRDVYKVENFLNEAELRSLRDVSHFMTVNPASLADKVNMYFLSAHTSKLKEETAETNMPLLLYANSLLKFLRTPSVRLKNKQMVQEICPYSSIIGRKIIYEFTQNTKGSLTRPSSMKDKAICFIMVLVLLACDFTLDMQVLSSCLIGVSQKKIRLLASAVGLVKKGAGMPNMYELKVPLRPIPSNPFVQRKKK